jgi:hypothetical protein
MHSRSTSPPNAGSLAAPRPARPIRALALHKAIASKKALSKRTSRVPLANRCASGSASPKCGRPPCTPTRPRFRLDARKELANRPAALVTYQEVGLTPDHLGPTKDVRCSPASEIRAPVPARPLLRRRRSCPRTSCISVPRTPVHQGPSTRRLRYLLGVPRG